MPPPAPPPHCQAPSHLDPHKRPHRAARRLVQLYSCTAVARGLAPAAAWANLRARRVEFGPARAGHRMAAVKSDPWAARLAEQHAGTATGDGGGPEDAAAPPPAVYGLLVASLWPAGGAWAAQHAAFCERLREADSEGCLYIMPPPSLHTTITTLTMFGSAVGVALAAAGAERQRAHEADWGAALESIGFGGCAVAAAAEGEESRLELVAERVEVHAACLVVRLADPSGRFAALRAPLRRQVASSTEAAAAAAAAGAASDAGGGGVAGLAAVPETGFFIPGADL
eukprot:SAG22_NODE_4_length_44774_cov_362.122149_8_plen_284_part_00